MESFQICELCARGGSDRMTDIVTAEQRSRNMSAIRSKNTKPEVYLRKLLYAEGYRYRIADRRIPGHPDIYLSGYGTAIFVNGCFWHRHEGCKYAYMPKSRVEFWQKKFSNNVSRDSLVRKELASRGIKCMIIWECTIKRMTRDEDMQKQVIRRVTEFLRDAREYEEL